MDLGPAFVSYLAEFYTVEQIRAFWKQAGDAAASRSRTVIHVTQTGSPGAGSTTGVNLATPAEFATFMTACQQAIAQKEGSLNPAAALAAETDFSQRAVLV